MFSLQLKQIWVYNLPWIIQKSRWKEWLSSRLGILCTYLAFLDHLSSTAEEIPGLHIDALVIIWHRAIPWCPSCILSKTLFCRENGTTIWLLNNSTLLLIDNEFLTFQSALTADGTECYSGHPEQQYSITLEQIRSYFWVRWYRANTVLLLGEMICVHLCLWCG